MTWANLIRSFLTLEWSFIVLINDSNIYAFAILNKWLKRELNQLKQFVYIICTENGLETFRATSDEFCLMAIYLQPNCIEICQETRPSTSDEIRIITNNLYFNCAEYELQTWLTPRQGIRVLAFDYTAHVWRIKHVTWFAPGNEISVLAYDIYLICSEYWSKHDLRQIKKFVCLRSAYSLSVLNKDWKHD